jgi:hypothetical protein
VGRERRGVTPPGAAADRTTRGGEGRPARTQSNAGAAQNLRTLDAISSPNPARPSPRPCPEVAPGPQAHRAGAVRHHQYAREQHHAPGRAP